MFVFLLIIIWLLIGVGVTYLYNDKKYVKANKKNPTKFLMWFFGIIVWPILLIEYFRKQFFTKINYKNV